MTYVLVEADPFAAALAEMGSDSKYETAAQVKDELSTVRRPYRGIQIKDDVYASLSIRSASNADMLLTSSSSRDDSGKVKRYSDFILQSISDSRSERHQVMETFGDSYIYFFGEKPRMITLSGVLINSEDFNWRAQFWDNYDKNLRGTQLVRKGARAYLSYDTIVIEGYPVQATAQESAQPSSNVIQFSLTMFVTGYLDYSDIGQTKFPNSEPEGMNILDDKLATHRSKFKSSTDAVYTANLNQAPASGVFDTIRRGMRSINDSIQSISNKIKMIDGVASGRVMRISSENTAGWKSYVGEEQVGVGTYDEWGDRISLESPWQDPWKDAKGNTVGHIYDNFDEYPEVDPEKARGRANPAIKAALDARQSKRTSELNAMHQEIMSDHLIPPSALVKAGEAVKFARDNFGMVMNALAFIEDPLAQAGNFLPVSGMSIKNSKKDNWNALKKSTSPYIGWGAAGTLANSAGRIKDNYTGVEEEDEVALGAVAEGEDGWELEYGGDSYTEPQDDSAHGSFFSSDAQPIVNPSEWEGDDYASPATPAAADMAAGLAETQSSSTTPEDEDTKGIRGVDGDREPLEPTV